MPAATYKIIDLDTQEVINHVQFAEGTERESDSNEMKEKKRKARARQLLNGWQLYFVGERYCRLGIVECP